MILIQWYLNFLCISQLSKHEQQANVLYLHMVPCEGKNEDHIIPGYCMLRVSKGLQKRIAIKFILLSTRNSDLTAFSVQFRHIWRGVRRCICRNSQHKSKKLQKTRKRMNLIRVRRERLQVRYPKTCQGSSWISCEILLLHRHREEWWWWKSISENCDKAQRTVRIRIWLGKARNNLSESRKWRIFPTYSLQ